MRARTAASTGSSSPRLSSGSSGAISSKALAPNQLNTAYEVDELRTRGLDGSGIRVNTLSSAVVSMSDFRTWAACFNQPVPKVTQFAMPGGVVDTQDDPDETVLDVEALATIAPRLERITPVFVPLNRNFGNSFILFMRGSLDPSGQGGELPDVLSISDGVCDYRFRNAEKHLGKRLLAEAAQTGYDLATSLGSLRAAAFADAVAATPPSP